MKTLMIVNRIDNWFDISDIELDECYVAMMLLERLSTRKKIGFDYDRFMLSNILYSRTSSEAIDIVDRAIVLLISRELIIFKNIREGKRKIVITDKGVEAYLSYKEEMKQ